MDKDLAKLMRNGPEFCPALKKKRRRMTGRGRKGIGDGMGKPKPPAIYTTPQRVRRELARRYGVLAGQSRWTAAERAEFTRMAQAWAATLPPKKKTKKSGNRP
jgi:hypothetical protein